MIGSRHYRLSAGLLHAGGDRFGVGRNYDGADFGRLRPPHHMHDHRLARDVGQRLAGQARGTHAGRNDNQDIAVGHRIRTVSVD
jgi:hypothetical protein